MKFLPLIFLLTFVSCAHQKVKPKKIVPAPHPVATDSIVKGKIKASAIKTKEGQNLCFYITLELKQLDESMASSSNWTTAYVDKKSRYYLLNIQNRNPASIPEGNDQERTAHFKACVTRVKSSTVKSLVLTPKNFPYDDNNELTLKWD